MPVLTLTNVQFADAGSYTVVLSDDIGSVTSQAALLTVLSLPVITQQPTPAYQDALQGSTFTLAVTATGTPPLSYKWRRNNITVLNQTNALLRTNATSGNAGNYTVIITNIAGAITSAVAVVVYRPDFDHDGLSDDWERQYGLNTNNAADAFADADTDGFLNWMESVAGTDPTNAASYLKIDRFAAPPDSVLTFQAVSNRTYLVQFTNTLAHGEWQLLAPFPATSTNRVVTVIVPATSNQFYRLAIPPSP
jgi:hypothetical protein